MNESDKFLTGFVMLLLVIIIGISISQYEKGTTKAEQDEAEKIAQIFAYDSEKAKLEEELRILRDKHQKRLEQMSPGDRERYERAERTFLLFISIGFQLAAEILTPPDAHNSGGISIPAPTSSKVQN